MIDSHCHLDMIDQGRDTSRLVAEAEAAGVTTIINIGIDLASSRTCIDLAHRFPGVRATVGVHPHDAAGLGPDGVDRLEELARDKRVVAIGEIGLDYYRDHSPRPIQRKVFVDQLALAIRLRLPVVIHMRESFDDTLAVIREHAPDLRGGVFHCFPGTIDDALKVIALGFVVSVGGIVTFKNSGMAEMAREVPLDKVILETDAPYLAPVPHRGKTNQPAYVAYVYRHLAMLKGLPVAEVEKTVDRTCAKLFGLVETFGE